VKLLLRLIGAVVLLFATYNPDGVSWVHWMARDGWAITPLKAFVGVCLLVGWAFLLHATFESLGAVGTMLAAAFFGTLVWVVVSYTHLEPQTSKGLTYLIMLVLAAVLSTGSIWSIWKRRATGQIDVDHDSNG